MREQILKLKKSQLFADKLTLILATIVVIFITMFITTYAAEDEDPNRDSPFNGINFTIAHLSELCSDSYSVMVTESGVSLSDTLDRIDNATSVGIIGNAFGPSSSVSEAKDKTTGGAEQGVDNASENYTLSGILYNYISSSADWNNATAKVKNSSTAQYMLLGMGMRELGLDEVQTADKGLNTGFRTIVGYVTYILYILAYTASNIITKVLEVLKNFNLFGIFLGDSYVGSAVRDSDIYKVMKATPFISSVQEWYKQIAGGMRFVIIGFMVLFLVGSMTVFKSKQVGIAATNQIRIRNFIYRLVIMFIGLPLAGMVYSEALAFAEGNIDENERSLGDYIMCQFVDMEGYFTANRPFSYLKFDIAYHGDEGVTVYQYDSDTEYDPVLFGYRINWVTSALYTRRIDLPEFYVSIIDGVPQASISAIDCNNEKVVPRTKINLYGDMNADTNTYKSIFENDSATYSLDSARKYEFDFCRKLILSYAQCDTIVPMDVAKVQYDNDRLELFEKVNELMPSDTDYELYINASAEVFKKLLNDKAVSVVWSKVANYDRTDDYNVTHEIIKDKCYIKQIGMAMFPNNYDRDTFDSNKNTGLYLTATDSSNPDDGEAIFAGILGHKTMSSSGAKYGQRYAYAEHSAKITFRVPGAASPTGGDAMSDVNIRYKYSMSYCGLSPLSMYNYLNSVFTEQGIRIQNPKETTNTHVAIQHYSVSTPYRGLAEIIYLGYTMSFLLALGVIGWVFGISLLMNAIVQGVKMIPSLFKMMIGSLTGFVEACTIGLSIVVEILVTMIFYSISLDVIDFMVQIVRVLTKTIIGLIVDNMDVKTSISNVAGIVIILWTIFQLIRWRQAITISIKSIITHTFNQVFGTNAKMSTGANGGMLGLAAAGAAAAVGLHALAGEDGGLAGVVDDLAGAGDGALADTLTGMKDDLANGDFDSAKNKLDEAKSMMRGANSDDEAAKGLGFGLDDTNSALSGDEQEEIAKLVSEGKFDEALEKQKEFEDKNIAEMAKKAGKEGAKGRGTSAQAYNDNMLTSAQQEDVDKKREEEGDDAADALQDEYMSQNMAKESMENPDAEFDAEGLTADDYAELDEMAKDPKTTEEDIENAKKEMREKNAKEHQEKQKRYAGLTQPEINDVKNHEAAGDEEGAQELADSYRKQHAAEDFENGVANEPLNENGLTSEQQAEYDALGGDASKEAQDYAKKCRADNEAKEVDSSGLTKEQRKTYESKAKKNTQDAEEYAAQCRAENMANATYEAGGPLDVDYSSGTASSAWADMAQVYDANGLTYDQQKVVARMVRDGASEEDVTKAIDSFAQQNFGDNYQEVRDNINSAAERSSGVSYGDINNADGDARVMSVGSVKNADGSVGYNVGTSQAVVDGNGQAMYDGNGNMKTKSSNASFSVREAGGVTSYTNNATGATSTLVDQSSEAGRGGGTYAGMYNASVAEQLTPGTVHGTGGTVTQLGTKNGVSYAARETAGGTQLIATDASGNQSVVSGVEANQTLLAFGYQASAGTTTAISSGGANYTVTETLGGPVVRDSAGQQVQSTKANQVIQDSGYSVANKSNLERQTNGITTKITSGTYSGYTITETGNGPVVFDQNAKSVSADTARNVIQDSGYTSYKYSGSDISHNASVSQKRMAARANAQASMIPNSTYNAGVSVGAETVTVAGTAKNSWQSSVANNQQAYMQRYDPVLNPEGYIGEVNGQKIYSGGSRQHARNVMASNNNSNGYTPIVHNTRDIVGSDEEIKYNEDSSNLAAIMMARAVYNKAKTSGEEVDPNADGRQ